MFADSYSQRRKTVVVIFSFLFILLFSSGCGPTAGVIIGWLTKESTDPKPKPKPPSAPTAPAKATNPSPSNQFSGTDLIPALSWTASGPNTKSDLYLGTSSTLTVTDLRASDLTSSTYTPLSSLQPSTTYYWRIDTKNDVATTTGDTWSLTTGADTIAPTFSGIASALPLGPSSIELRWSAASDNISSSAKITYSIFVSESSSVDTAGNADYVTEPGVTSFIVGGLKTEITYYFVVWAKDEFGNKEKNTKEQSAKTTVAITYSWKSGPDMTTERSNARATFLSDGRVLITGGEQSGNTVLSSAEIYDPATNSFAVANAMNTTRKEHSATLLTSGKVLIVGGSNGTTDLNTAEIYDPDRGTFTTIAPLNTAHSSHTATLLSDGKVLIAGGKNGSSAINTAEIYDPTTGQFSAVSNMQIARTNHTATLLKDGKVLLLGGNDGNINYFDSGELYDPNATNNGFTLLPAKLSFKRSDHTATILRNGKVLVAGGRENSGSFLNTAELYNPATQTFSITANNMTNKRGLHTAVLLPSGNVILSGGKGGSNFLSAYEIYHSATDQFTSSVTGTVANIQPAQNKFALLLSNGEVLLGGGYNGLTYIKKTELLEYTTGVFDSTSPMPEKRVFHTTTLLPSGKVLITGGKADTVTLDTALLYDPSFKTYTATASTMNERRNHHTATLLPTGKVLIVGGENATGSLNSTELYDPSTDSFSSLSTLNIPRTKHIALLLDGGNVLIAGGKNGSGLVSEVEIYEASTGSFVPVGALNTPRYKTSGVLLSDNNALLFGGGLDQPDSSTDSLENFDGFQFINGGFLNRKRRNHINIMLLGDIPLVVGGVINSSNLPATAETYQGGSMADSGDLNTPRQDLSGTVLLGGNVLLVGGKDQNDNFLSSSEIYHSGKFYWGSNLNKARSSHTATLLPNGEVLIAGGQDAASGLAESELFKPSIGNSTDWAPVIESIGGVSSFPLTLTIGSTVHIRGKRLMGLVSNTASSRAPVVVLTGLTSSNGRNISSINRYLHLSAKNFSTTGFDVTLASTNILEGYYLLSVISNGIPSFAKIIKLQKSGISQGLTITSISPPAGSTAQDTFVFISGSGFDSNTSISIGTVNIPQSNITLVDSETLKVKVPAGNLGQQNVGISNSSGLVILVDGFSFYNPPTISSFTPTQGLAKGKETITVNGTNFVKGLTTLMIGSSSATGVNVINSTQLKATTPGGLGLQPVKVEAPGGTVTGGDFTFDSAPPSFSGLIRVLPLTSSALELQWNSATDGISPKGKISYLIYMGTTSGGQNYTTENYKTALGKTSLIIGGLNPNTPYYFVVRARDEVGHIDTNTVEKTATTLAPPSLSWVNTASSMSTARENHSAILLPSGRVFVLGGRSGTTILNSAEVYNPATGAFSSIPSPGSARYNHSVTLLKSGKILVAGGIDSNTPSVSVLNTAKIYDPANETFSPNINLISKRMNHSATLLGDGKILFTGGSDGTSALSTSEIYNPGNPGSFSATGSMTKSRKNHTATLLKNGKVLIAGGSDGTNTLNTAELYDPSTNTFSLLTATLSSSRQYHSATLLKNGKVLILGGNDGTIDLNTAELYDPSTNSFSSIAALSSPRKDHSLVPLPSGKFLIIGGSSGATALKTTEYFDESTNTFSSGPSMLTPRTKVVAIPLPSGKILVLGGNDGINSLSSAELLDLGAPNFITSNNSLAYGRLNHSATLLGNGKVLITGGEVDPFTFLKKVELYDPSTDTFSTTGDLSLGRTSHRATLLPGGKVLITGGMSGIFRLPTQKAEIYDPTAGTFSDTGNMFSSRYDHTATLLPDGTVLIAGGWNGAFIASAEIYDPATGIFSATTGSMISARSGHRAILLENGKVLITGGTGASVLNSAELYDPASGTFSATTGNMTTARKEHTITLIGGGKVLILGGSDGTNILNTGELYDPVTNTFTLLSSTMTSTRSQHTSCLLPSGKVLIVGGWNGTSYLKSAEIYDPEVSAFQSIPDLNTLGRARPSVLLPSGKVLIPGGESGTTVLNSAEIFEPGLGFSTLSQPLLTQIEEKNMLGDRREFSFSLPLLVTGQNLKGFTSGSTGAIQNSPSNSSQVLLMGLSGGIPRILPLDSSNLSATGFEVNLPSKTNNPNGFYLLFVRVQGIPSVGIILELSAPKITSITPENGPFSPQNGPSGGNVSAIITGKFFSALSSVTIGGQNFIVSSTTPTQITGTIPANSPGAKDVVVNNGNGGSDTLSGGFTYHPAPTISNINPLQGPLGGGGKMTITGTNFVNGATVTIGGSSATNVIVENSTTITLTIPAGTVGLVNVVITTYGGQANSAGAFDYLEAPTITSISPNEGSTAGGQNVTITGTKFKTGALTKVTIDGSPLPSKSIVNDTTITGQTPAGTTGAKNVVVITAGGATTPLIGGFTYYDPPTIASFSPPEGPLTGGTSVTITGTNFRSGKTTATIGGNALNISAVTSTTITGTIPAGTQGLKDIVVTVQNVGSVTSANKFLYYIAPTITAITPAVGVLAGSQDVTITGTNFTSGSGVTIGGVGKNLTNLVVVSPTTITGKTPSGTAGKKDVVVTTAGGSATLTQGFEYDNSPPTFAGLALVTPLNSSTLRLFWNAASDNITPSKKIIYYIYMATTSGGQNYFAPSFITLPGVTNYTIGGLSSGQAHYFVVVARDEAGNLDGNVVEKTAPTTGTPTLSWVAGGVMGSARNSCTLTLLGNGKVLIAGGNNGTSVLNTAEIYDPAMGTFSSTSNNMTSPRQFHRATLLQNGRVLITGGNNGSGSLNTAELYDPGTKVFSAVVDSMKSPRENHTLTLLPGGDVLLSGGKNGTAVLNTAELFEADNNTFAVIPNNLSSKREGHSASLLASGKVLLSGGSDGATALSSAEVYDPSTTTFTATASGLSAGRFNHISIALPDGKVLVCGGENGTSTLSTSDLYDPTANTFSPATALPGPITNASVLLLPSGKVLITGGNNGGILLNTTYLYDYKKGTFASLSATLATARKTASAIVLPNGKVFVAGGSGASGPLASTEILDVSEPASYSSYPLGTARAQTTATLLPNRMVLIAGGWNGTAPLGSCELFDPDTATFSASGASLSGNKMGHSATLLPNGKVLIAGGWDGSSYLNTAELYDPTTDKFSPTPNNMSVFRAYHSATLLANGTVLLAGGKNSGGDLSSSEIYDPATGQFSAGPALSALRSYHSATLLMDGRVILIGGMTGVAPLNTTDIYNPTAGTFGAGPVLTSNRAYHSATLLPGGTVLIAGGWDGTISLNTAVIYTPGTGFSAPLTMTTARQNHSAAIFSSGKVLLAAGMQQPGGTYLNSMEIYDPQLGTFKAIGTLPTTASNRTALVVPEGQVVLFGGSDSTTTVVNTCEYIDLGMGNDGNWSPSVWKIDGKSLSPFDGSLSASIEITGSYFQFYREAVGNPNHSSTNYPVAILKPLGGSQFHQLTPQKFSEFAITLSTPSISTTPAGYYLLFLIRSGLPSRGEIIRLGGPEITTLLSPSEGSLSGSETITITGRNFVAGNTTLTIGGNTPSNVIVTSPTSLTCITPSGTVSSGISESKDVVITTPAGSFTVTGGFTYYKIPTISTVSPDYGLPAGGTAITITGTNFATGKTSVTIGGANVSGLNIASITTLTCDSPTGLVGPADVKVITPGGTATKTGGFLYMDSPQITLIGPNAGPLAGGTDITITGNYFEAVNTTVTIGGNAASVINVIDKTSLTCKTPGGTVGAKDVVVTTLLGGSTTQTGGFTYRNAPTITAAAKQGGGSAEGSTSGQTVLTITGTGFVTGPNATTVTIGGSNATSVNVASATSLSCTTPSGSVGPVDIVVTTAGGTDTLTNGFTYFAPPTITAINPAYGAVGGGTTVTITGTNFIAGKTAVTLGGNSATGVNVISATSLTCTTPASTPAGTKGTVDVILTTPAGSDPKTNGYEYDGNTPTFNGLVLVRLTSPTSVELRWMAATDNLTPPFQIKYSIYFATTLGGQNFTTPLTSVTGQTQTQINSLQNGTSYYFVVRAKDQANNEEKNKVEKSIALLSQAPLKWKNLSSMSSPRSFHSATILGNGKILIAGGYNGSATLNTAEIYDPATGSFSATGNPMSSLRKNHSATILPDGKVLIVGGENGTTTLNTAEIYDPTTDTFTPVTNLLSSPRKNHSATLLSDGKVLIGAGANGASALNTAEIFDPGTNPVNGTFSTTSNNLINSRFSHTATLLSDGKVLFCGGNSGTATLQSTEIYNPTSNSFSAGPAMNSPRQEHGSILLQSGEVLVAGGSDGTVTLNTAEIYKPTGGTFSTVSANMNNSREKAALAIFPDGRVLIAGGKPQSGAYHSSAEIYNPTTGAFDSATPMGSIRAGHTLSVLADGRVVAIGGLQDVNTALSSAEICHPTYGTFGKAINDLVAGRYTHTATLLPSGKILITGGGSSGTILNSAELYDSVNETFSPTGNLGTARQAHTATLLPNGKVLIAGGITNGNSTALNSAEIYDPASGTFSATGNLTTTRAWHSATLFEDPTDSNKPKVLIVGGTAGVGGLSSAELYDPSAGTFTALANNLNTGRYYHSTTLLASGKILLVGGYGSSYLNSCELFDPTARTFTYTSGSLLSARQNHSATLLPNGKVLIAGGQSGSALNTCELYDPTADSFSSAGTMTALRYAHSATLLPGGRVLIAGGTANGATPLNSGEIYDPSSASFSSVGTLQVARFLHTAILLPQGQVVMIGGSDGSQGVGSAEFYFLGLGNPTDKAPVISKINGTSTFPVNLSFGTKYTVEGSGFMGYGEGGQGNTQQSPSNFPQLILLSLGSGGYGTMEGGTVRYYPLSAASVSATSLDVKFPFPGVLPTGYYMLMVSVNGIYGQGRIIRLEIPPIPPSIVSIDPSVGKTAGGNVITITGTGFVPGGTTVTIGGVPMQNISVNPAGTSLTGTIPAGSEGKKDVVVTTAGGVDTRTKGFTYDGTPPTFGGATSATPISPYSIELRWNSASDNLTSTGDMVYAIYMGTTTGGQNFTTPSFTSEPGVTRFTAGGLSPTTTYYFVVRARDKAGNEDGNSVEKSAATVATPAGAWVNTGSMGTARNQHQGTLLPNGKVLITGGSKAGPVFYNTAELYDPNTGTFVAIVNMTATRNGHKATLLSNGKVLLTGGNNPSSASNSAETFDPSTGTFTITAGTMNSARFHHTATLLFNGKVLVVGGLTSYSSGTNTADIYNPATNNFSSTGAMNTARGAHTATLLSNGKVLIAGGSPDNNPVLNTAELYDPNTGTFTATGNMTSVRRNHIAILLPNEKVLLCGGTNGVSSLNTAELYDPSTGTFTATGNMSNARGNHTATLLPNGKVLIAGGASISEIYNPSTGTFSNTASMNTNRDQHIAVLLPSGKVLVTGGGQAIASAEIYDPSAGGFTGIGSMGGTRYASTGTMLPNGKVLIAGENIAKLYDPSIKTFLNTGSMTATRRSHSATLLPNGKVLIAGGIVGGSISNSAELYNPSTGTFTVTGSMSGIRVNHSATLLPNGKVLIAGGYIGGPSHTNTAELYDPVTGTFSNTGSMITARREHISVLLPNGKVLVVGGYNGSFLNSAEIYNPATGTWSSTASMNTARNAHRAVLLPNGKVLVMGGYTGGSYNSFNSAEIYDPTTGTWSYTGSMNTARLGFATTLLPNGTLLVIGGANGSGYTSSAEIYDPATGLWRSTGSLAIARYFFCANLLPTGRVLVTGGVGTSGPLDNVELYDPGLGYSSSWQPVVAKIDGASSFPSILSYGATITIDGQRFKGLSEAMGGSFQSSPTNYPIVRLVGLDGGGGYSGNMSSASRIFSLSAKNWTDTQFQVTLPVATNNPEGYYMMYVIVNGIPSEGRIIKLQPVQVPGLTLLSPNFGGAGGGNTITLTGSGFVSGNTTVNFGTNAGTNVVVIDSNTLTVDVPAGSGTVPIQVITPGGNSGTANYIYDGTLPTFAGIASANPTSPTSVEVRWNAATDNISASSKIVYEIYYSTTSGQAFAGGVKQTTATGATSFNVALLQPATLYYFGVRARDEAGNVDTNIMEQPVTTPAVAAGGWVYTGSMGTARMAFSATLLLDGKVLVAGGGRIGPVFFDTAELYDPATGSFATLASKLNTVRQWHTATLLHNGKVLIAGGWTTGALNTAELYDPVTKTFSLTTGNMLRDRGYHTSTLLPNGKVLITGGYSALGNVTNTAEVYDPATNTFYTTGSMSVARVDHTATLLPNGKVLIAGGHNGSNTYYYTTEIYDPATGTFSNAANMISPRKNFIAVLLPNQKVLIAGGYDGNTGLNVAELYDPSSNTFVSTGNMAYTRVQFSAVLLPNGKVLVAGKNSSICELYDPSTGTFTTTGSLSQNIRFFPMVLLASGKVMAIGGDLGAGNAISSAEIYDPSAGSFSGTGSMGEPRDTPTTTLLPNGKVLVVGGVKSYGPTVPSNGAELYDSAKGTFSNTGSINTKRWEASATLLPSGKVLIAGGYNGGAINTAELYDPVTGIFSYTGNMNIGRFYHTATLLPNGKVLIAGGDDGPTYIGQAELYDPVTGVFTTTGTMQTARETHTATLLPNGKVLITGGYSGSFLNTTELYDPATGTFTYTATMSTARNTHRAILLPSGKVLVMGGNVGSYSNSFSNTELYDPATGTFSASGSMNVGRSMFTPILLSNGNVLIMGGNNGTELKSVELYDSTKGTFKIVGSMATARHRPGAKLLPIGKVLVLGGSGSGVIHSSAELYDPGLGFSTSWQPVISKINGSFTFPIALTFGNNYSVEGLRLKGISEASGGNFQNSSTNYPIVRLVKLSGDEGGSAISNSSRIFSLSATSWTATSFTVDMPKSDYNPAGYYMMTVIVNGIPSEGRIIKLDHPAPTITGITPGIDGIAGGKTVTITGTGFIPGVTLVTIGGKVLGNINIISPTQITATIPSGSAGTYDVIVSSGAGGSNATLPGGFTYDNTPPTFAGGVTPAVATSGSSIELRWSDASDDKSVAANIRYNIYYATTSGNQNFAAPNYTSDPGANKFQVPLLTASTIYYFVVRAVDEAGNVESNVVEVSATTLATPAANIINPAGMNAARASHTATLLPNGKILITGGYNGTTLNSAELYDPSIASFTTTNNMNTARRFHTATLLPNGKVLIVGGHNGTSALNSCELYDPSTGTFTNTGSLNFSRYSHRATLLINGTVLISGGSNGSSQLSSTELYDPATGTFFLTSSLNVARENHTSTLLPGGKVLIVGGSGAGSYLTSVEIYDPATASFTTTGNLNRGRTNHTATLLSNGKVLIVGGYDGINPLSSVEIYDPNTGVSTNSGNLNYARNSHTANLLPNGNVLIAFGGGSGNVIKYEIYNPNTGTFTTYGTFAGVIRLTATILPSGKVLLTGGTNQSTYTNAAEIFELKSGNFYATGNTVASGDQNNAILLPNGKVLIIQSTTVVAELYDPATGNFTTTGSMNSQRRNFTAILLPNGKVLITGGHDGTGYDSEIYDPGTGIFSIGPSMTIYRQNHTSTLLPNGKVLLAGGSNPPRTTTYNTAEIYDPMTNTFSVTANNMPTGHREHTATLLNNGKVLIVGGYAGGYTAAACLYDPVTNSFTATGSLNQGRNTHSASLLPNGKVLIAAGSAGGAPLSSAELYDPSLGNFFTTGALNTGRFAYTSLLLLNGKVILIGGQDVNGAISSTEFYDPVTGTFSFGPSMTGVRQLHATILLPNGKLLNIGGQDATGLLNTAELYDLGLGYASNWKPVISKLNGSSTFPFLTSFGTTLTVEGLRFKGISEASGGNKQNSSTNYPQVILMGIGGAGGYYAVYTNINSRFFSLSATNWTATSFNVTMPSVTNNPPGYYMMVVIVNGIPSEGRIVKLQ